MQLVVVTQVAGVVHGFGQQDVPCAKPRVCLGQGAQGGHLFGAELVGGLECGMEVRCGHQLPRLALKTDWVSLSSNSSQRVVSTVAKSKLASKSTNSLKVRLSKLFSGSFSLT